MTATNQPAAEVDPRAVQLIRDIGQRWTTFWKSLEEDEDEDVAESRRRGLKDIADAFQKPLAEVAPSHLMAALFVEQAGTGAARGLECAIAFVWTRMSYRQWVEVARHVLVDPHAWYELMWFCHTYLQIDYFTMLDKHGIAQPEMIKAQKLHRPSQITLRAQPVEETLEWQAISAAGCDPRELWVRLRSEGAPPGKVEEVGNE
jgi:hypothetical protein